ncbi:MAG: DUF2254 domain-containing protein [Cyclobacteriaceae bacterium]|nr:DUF2254 domain-containing protein [Cyclobacteriaceae bacterium]
MKARFIYVWEYLQTNFWFIPLILVFIAIGSSFGLVYIDSTIQLKSDKIFLYFITGGVESARIILSTIASGMLGVASIVFSITLVVLTLASSQFGSRMLRNFMHDRINQFVLGTYLATYIYCLLVLRTVKSEQSIEFVPNLSVMFAILVAMISIFLLIIFIHHISVSIQADQIISDIASNLNKRIHEMFPLRNEIRSAGKAAMDVKEMKNRLKTRDCVYAVGSGYLQVIDFEGLLKIAREKNLLMVIGCKPGDFIVEKSELMQMYSAGDIIDETKQDIKKSIILGKKRTPTQDPEFAIHQMVQIASRALSSGINDPYTAITCIDNLSAIMCSLTQADFPTGFHYDEEDQLRMVTRVTNFSGMLDASFNEIRQFADGNPPVLIRLMEGLNSILTFAGDEEQKNALERHRTMVFNAGKTSMKEQFDLEDLKDRYEMHKVQ